MTLDEIRAAFPVSTYVAGQHYWRNGHVVLREFSSDGGPLRALVLGSRPTPYEVAAAIHRDTLGRPAVAGTCSCPVSFNCKHVVAALLSAAANGMPYGTPGATVGSLPAPGNPAPGDLQMPWALTAWLQELGVAKEGAPPAAEHQRLLYIADCAPEPHGGRDFMLIPVVVNVLNTGALSGKYRPFNLKNLSAVHPPSWQSQADRSILRRLSRLTYVAGEEAEEALLEALERVFATGRGRWLTVGGPVLRQGPRRSGRTVWRTDQEGYQRPTVELPKEFRLIRLPDPWYVEIATGETGPLDLDIPKHIAKAILKAPEVSHVHAAAVRAAIRDRFPGLALPSPEELRDAVSVTEPPRPRLRLHAATLPNSPRDLARAAYAPLPPSDPVRVPVATLSFQYGPVLRGPFAGEIAHLEDGTLYSIVPDQAVEGAAMTALYGMRLTPARFLYYDSGIPDIDGMFVFEEEGDRAWVELLLEGVESLREAGWDIEIADDFPIRIATATGGLTANLREGSGIDWFELELGIEVDGQRVDLAPTLINLLSNSKALAFILGSTPDSHRDDEVAETIMLTLQDGRRLSLLVEQLRPILVALLDLFGARPPGNGKFRVNRLAAAELADMEAASAARGVVWAGGEALLALGRRLRGGTGIPVATIPASFQATLRDYQARGVDWLQFLRESGIGGVLADDMGLGKTVQTLAHLVIEQEAGRLDRPALIVCPTSLVPNWCLEAARFAPSLRVLPLHGPLRRERFGEVAAHDVVITTYPLLARDREMLTDQEWHLLVLDEAQTIKNPDATTTKLVGGLPARQRLALSGTPLENHLGELWSLFHFLSPGFLGDRSEFQRRFRTPIERGGDEARRASLVRLVRPFLLRRTKQEVAAELPPKTEITEAIEMGAAQRAVYESIRLTMHARVRAAIAERGLARSGIIMLDALLKLRQACCDPRLLKLKSAKANAAGSAKLDRLMEMLPEMLEEGRKILLFSQFTSMLALIRQELDARAIPFVTLTGDTTDRLTPVARFQSGETKLFLISLKAGGVGLNLTNADTVIHYDPWWNPAVEDQATDRAHRIGQLQAVFVHKLMVLGSIEQKMDELKARKRALVDSILAGAGAKALTLTEGDIDELFGA